MAAAGARAAARPAARGRPAARAQRPARAAARATAAEPSKGLGGGGHSDDTRNQYRREKTRRGRPASKRNPDDSPLRDGNRDRLMGLLTERAAHTLRFYLLETSPPVCKWWDLYIKAHRIPLTGEWHEVSGDEFIRELMRTPDVEYDPFNNDEKFARGSFRISPREMAQRVLSVRSQLAKEFIEDLGGVTEDNQALLRENIEDSFKLESHVDEEHPATVNADLLKGGADQRRRGGEGVPRSRGGGQTRRAD